VYQAQQEGEPGKWLETRVKGGSALGVICINGSAVAVVASYSGTDPIRFLT
jgi:hypothetical protein